MPHSGVDIYLIRTDSLGQTDCFVSDTTINAIDATTVENTFTSSLTRVGSYQPQYLYQSNTYMIGQDVCAVASSMPVEQKRPSILVYPNPANTDLFIESDVDLKRFTLMNVYGNLLLDQSIKHHKEQVAFRNLPTGIYILSVEDSQGNWVTRRVVKN